MKLNNESLKQATFWEKAEIKLPGFDREKMIAATLANPKWVHFGAGNIFRAFPAALMQTLLEKGLETTGIVVAEGYDGEIIDKCFTPCDNLTLLVTLKSNGTTEKQLIASIASSLRLDRDFDILKSIFTNPSLQMISFTITEKGYNLKDRDNNYFPDIAQDLKAAPLSAKSLFGRIAAMCHERYKAGEYPLSLVSMDNCSHNGDLLFTAIEAFAKAWTDNNSVNKGFLDYVRNKEKMGFPWTMIDKITPRPDEGVRDMLIASGLKDMQDLVTQKNTFIAPFVNAEETQYLVIEDAFPNGKPALEKTGVLFADKETVDKVEKMKVCTCLNPLHTALAIFGCLLGYTRISEEMKDPLLVNLIKGIGYREGLPVVVNPGILDPKEFIDQVINVRLPNPFMPDAPQRIATDTSQKIPVRFGETIKAYKNKGKDIKELTLIPLVFAGWLRYILGIDDEGKPFEPSPDPLYENLKTSLSGITLGKSSIDKADIHNKLKPVLSNPSLFGLDLYEAGLAALTEDYFITMLDGPGAVRALLKKLLS